MNGRRLRPAALVALIGSLLVAVSLPSWAQDVDSGTLEWIVTVPRTDRQTTTPVGFAVDEEGGDLVAVLNVEGSVAFGGGEVPQTDLETGTYVVRIGLDGVVKSVVPLTDPAEQMALAGDGDLLVASNDRTLARLGPDGEMRWEQRIGGVFGPSVTELVDGTIVLAAQFMGTVTLGAGEPNEATLTDPNDRRFLPVFVAWFDPDGGFLGADTWLGASEVDVAALPDGSLRVLGVATAAFTIGSGQTNETLIDLARWVDSPGEPSVLASYGPDRQLQWAVETGASYGGDVIDVAVSEDGAAVIWQSIQEPGVMGLGGENETPVVPLRTEGEFGDDHLLARYSADGTFEWVHVMGSPTYTEEEYRSLNVRSTGDIVATGTLAAGTTTIGGPDGLTVEVGETARHFVAVFAPDGAFQWATALGSESFDTAWGSVLLADGDVVVFGLTGGPMSVGFPGAETPVADEAVWYVARFDGLEPEPEPTTTTAAPTPTAAPTTTAAPTSTVASLPADDIAAVESDGDGDGDGGGGIVVGVVVVMVAGLGGLALFRQRRQQ